MFDYLKVNPSLACWIIALLIAVIAEAATLTSLVAIWFMPGILVAILLCIFGVSFGIQIAAFLIVSLIFVIATKPLGDKFLNKNTKATNFDRVIGQNGIVVTEINNLVGTGCVKVDGKEWTARSDSDGVIPVGTIVVIDKIDGVKLLVHRSETE